MTTVLGLMGSPRKGGNTDILLEQVLYGAGQGGAQTSLVRLADLKINDCTGCFSCWNHGECVVKDDMIDLYGKIAAADIIVFATPVYWYGPTALMKAVLDRFVLFNNPKTRPMVRGKKAVLVAPLEESAEAAELLSSMFEKSFRYLEMNFAGRLIVPGVFHKGDVRKQPGVLKSAQTLGRSLATHK